MRLNFPQGQFGAVWGDQHAAHIAVGQVAYHVKGLDFALELFVAAQGDGVYQTVVIPAVDGGRDGVDIDFGIYLSFKYI